MNHGLNQLGIIMRTLGYRGVAFVTQVYEIPSGKIMLTAIRSYETAARAIDDLVSDGRYHGMDELWLIRNTDLGCYTVCKESDSGRIKMPPCAAIVGLLTEPDCFISPIWQIRIGPGVITSI